jgi:nucleoside phosphorylase
MKILILEDDLPKLESIKKHLAGLSTKIVITECSNLLQYNTHVERDKFELIIADLIVPIFEDDTDTKNVAERIVVVTRDPECINSNTPIVAITMYDYAAEENYKALNEKGVSIATYNDTQDWRATLTEKVYASMPLPTYDVVIICALKKEAKAFEEAGYIVSPVHTQHGLECREITVGTKKGIIVSAHRMGLVGAAISTARAIDAFKPKLVCMSGICAGIAGEAKIYDVVVTQICQQHDFGKWKSGKFLPEHHAVQLNHALELKINALIDDEAFKTFISSNIVLKGSEFPEGMEDLKFDIFSAPTSSGSAVIADDEMADMIKGQRRKAAAFEMEAFAVYEAARIAVSEPLFFSAKSVVDDGTVTKSDNFHRVAAILSAKTIYELIDKIL